VSESNTWAMCNLDGEAVIPQRDSNVGDWLHEIEIERIPDGTGGGER
jgi:hypothetical protein